MTSGHEPVRRTHHPIVIEAAPDADLAEARALLSPLIALGAVFEGRDGLRSIGIYNDLVDPWRSGGTVPLPFTREAVGRATVSTLTLSP